MAMQRLRRVHCVSGKTLYGANVFGIVAMAHSLSLSLSLSQR